jgi:hypothetical protein
MVFGMCANRVIGFAVAFVKDVVAAKNGVERSNTETVAGPKFEEITTEEKKTI